LGTISRAPRTVTCPSFFIATPLPSLSILDVPELECLCSSPFDTCPSVPPRYPRPPPWSPPFAQLPMTHPAPRFSRPYPPLPTFIRPHAPSLSPSPPSLPVPDPALLFHPLLPMQWMPYSLLFRGGSNRPPAKGYVTGMATLCEGPP
jgi:hypothetical protein